MPATPWAGTRHENQQLPDGAANVASRVPPRPGRGGPAPAEQASRLPAVLGPERVAGLVDQARVRFYAAA